MKCEKCGKLMHVWGMKIDKPLCRACKRKEEPPKEGPTFGDKVADFLKGFAAHK